MSLSIGQQHDLYKLAVGVYQAAPGTLYLSMLSDSLLAGASMAQLYERLAAHPSFQGQHADYGDSASDAQFVRRFVENLVADGALAADKDAIAAHFAGLLPGSSRGAIMKLAIDLLDAVPESDATWGRAGALLHNRIEAARYYTETLQGSGTDLAVLRTTIATVTSGRRRVRLVLAAIPFGYRNPEHQERCLGSFREVLAP